MELPILLNAIQATDPGPEVAWNATQQIHINIYLWISNISKGFWDILSMFCTFLCCWIVVSIGGTLL